MNKLPIDFRSDCATQPTEKMRIALKNGFYGNFIFREDPNVKELERLGAKFFGKEDSILIHSGTFGNLCAILAHCTPGASIYVGEKSYIATLQNESVPKYTSCSLKLLSEEKGRINLKEVEILQKA